MSPTRASVITEWATAQLGAVRAYSMAQEHSHRCPVRILLAAVMELFEELAGIRVRPADL